MEPTPKPRRKTKKQLAKSKEEEYKANEIIQPVIIEEEEPTIDITVKIEEEEEDTLPTIITSEPSTTLGIQDVERKSITPDPSPFLFKSLLNLLIIISSRHEIFKTYEEYFNSNILEILSLLLKTNSDFFVLLEDSFTQILSDNSIDSNDVPELMRILSILYEIVVNLETSMDALDISKMCGNLLKFFFYVTFTERIIQVDESMPNCFNSLVNSCVSLMLLNKPSNKKVSKIIQNVEESKGEELKVEVKLEKITTTSIDELHIKTRSIFNWGCF
jgi:hypothetical protein